MGAVASLNPTAVAVDPGFEVTSEIRVHNSGTIVDQFTPDVLGEAAAWSVVDPPALSLLPGTEGIAIVHFAPPRATNVPAGIFPFAVRVTSKEDPEGSTTEEGTIEVLPFRDLYAELIPRTTRGKREGHTELAVDNRGNQSLNAELSAVDANEMLLFHFGAPGMVANPNTAVFSKLGIRPKKSFWRGPPKTHNFQVLVSPLVGPPVAVDGVMLQEALLPKWILRAILALLALLVLLAILWLTLLKPAIKSEAKKAVAGPLASQSAAAAVVQASQAAQASQQAAAVNALAAGQKQLGDAVPKVAATPLNLPTVPTSTASSGLVSGLGDPFRIRLPAAATFPAGQTRTDAYTVPAKTTLSMADILIENPAGDSGTLTVLQDGNVLLVENLDNFRDLDFHFVSPPQFAAGQKLILSVACAANSGALANPPAPGRICTPAVFVSGFQRTSP